MTAPSTTALPSRSTRRLLAAAALSGSLLAALPAAAQDVPADQALELQQFQLAPGPQTFLGTRDAMLLDGKQLQLGIGVSYSTGGLTVYNVDEADGLTTRTEVVDAILAGQLTGAYGLSNDFQLGLVVPLTFAMTGNGLDPATGANAPDGLSVTGTGDALVEVAWRAYAGDGLAIALIGGATLPSSTSIVNTGADKGGFLGDDLPSFRPRAALSWRSPSGKWVVGANLGAIIQKKRTLYATEIGPQLTFSVAGLWRTTGRVEFVAEVFGRNGFSADEDSSPLEADGGVRVRLTRSLSVLAGGGGGLNTGLGAPAFRAFAGVSWSPDYGDSDSDGIPNQSDRCPNEPEDRDGFEDSDGCPDPDNDNDAFLDAEDKCPLEAEDKDGFEDEDGCPEPDNDKDGLLDGDDRCPDEAEDKLPPFDKDGCPASRRDSDDDGVPDNLDKCPTEPEDKDGFQDDDGCPDLDNDGDGVPDEDDKCPTAMEDKDGYADDDGCPDPDNDADGVLDGADKCPGQKETINGVRDDDGCPDTGGRQLARMEGNLVKFAEPVAFDGTRIRSRAVLVLDQTVLVMRSQTDVVKWRIVVAAERQRGGDEATRLLSQQRADAIKAFLVAKGLPADQIEAVGVVADTPNVGIAAIERGEAPPPQSDGAPAAPADGGGEDITIE